jgi:hypothetical protein
MSAVFKKSDGAQSFSEDGIQARLKEVRECHVVTWGKNTEGKGKEKSQCKGPKSDAAGALNNLQKDPGQRRMSRGGCRLLRVYKP